MKLQLSLKFSGVLIIQLMAATAYSAWLPMGADTSYPRVLLKKDSIAAIRNNLVKAPNNILYSQVYASATAAYYFPNSSDNERRARATSAKNSAFVYLMNVKSSGNTSVALSSQERDTVLNRCIRYLNNINTGIDSITTTNYTAYDSWQWRSKELINYLIAYDFLKGAGVNDALLSNAKNKLQEFAGHLYKECNRTVVIGNFWTLVSNNFTLITTGALGTAAIVLNDVQSSDPDYRPEMWIQAAMIKTDDALFTNTKRETERNQMAGFAEGPHYMLYSLLHYAPFYTALKNFIPDGTATYSFGAETKNLRHPFYDTAYDQLFDWLYKIRMPDGRVPAIEDSFLDEFISALSLTQKEKYNIMPTFNNLELRQTRNFPSSLNGADNLMANYLCMNYKSFNTNFQNDSLLSVMPMAGNAVFRSSWDSNAVYMHLTAKYGTARIGAGGHNHADELSFIIYAYGQLLALDPGYIQYNSRNQVCNGNNHNMILVNNTASACGSVFSEGGADAFIGVHYTFPEFDFVKATTQYQNTNIERDVLFIAKQYFVTADYMHSIVSNNYSYQLHGWGQENGTDSTGYFNEIIPGRVVYKKNNVSLGADIKSIPPSIYSKILSPHELTYNSVQNHTAYLATSPAVKNGHFLSLLYPYISNAPSAAIAYHNSNLMMSNGNEYISSKNDSSVISITLNSDTVITDADLTYIKDSAGYHTCFGKNITLLNNITKDKAKSFSLAINTRGTIYIKQLNDTTIDIYSDSGIVMQFNNYHKIKSITANINTAYFGNNSSYQIKVKKTGWHRIIFYSEPAAGIYNYQAEIGLNIFPNPAGEELAFIISGSEELFNAAPGLIPQYQILDITGKQLITGPITSGQNKVNISFLSGGIYLLKVDQNISRFIKN